MHPILEVVAPTTYLQHEPTEGCPYNIDISKDVMDELWDVRPEIKFKKLTLTEKPTSSLVKTASFDIGINSQKVGLSSHAPLVNEKQFKQEKDRKVPLDNGRRNEFNRRRLLPSITTSPKAKGVEHATNADSHRVDHLLQGIQSPAYRLPPIYGAKQEALISDADYKYLGINGLPSCMPVPPKRSGFPTKPMLHRRYKGGRCNERRLPLLELLN